MAYSAVAVMLALRALASKRWRGANAWLIAGDFIAPGRAITHPQRFGTSIQSVFLCGRMPIFRPNTALRPTIADAPRKSGGHCMRSLMSRTQGVMDRGRNSSSKLATFNRPDGNGLG